MGKTISSSALVGLLLLTIAGHHANASPVSKEDGGIVVITFKDGHQQSIRVSAIAAMEFKSPRVLRRRSRFLSRSCRASAILWANGW